MLLSSDLVLVVRCKWRPLEGVYQLPLHAPDVFYNFLSMSVKVALIFNLRVFTRMMEVGGAEGAAATPTGKGLPLQGKQLTKQKNK